MAENSVIPLVVTSPEQPPGREGRHRLSVQTVTESSLPPLCSVTDTRRAQTTILLSPVHDSPDSPESNKAMRYTPALESPKSTSLFSPFSGKSGYSGADSTTLMQALMSEKSKNRRLETRMSNFRSQKDSLNETSGTLAEVAQKLNETVRGLSTCVLMPVVRRQALRLPETVEPSPIAIQTAILDASDAIATVCRYLNSLGIQWSDLSKMHVREGRELSDIIAQHSEKGVQTQSVYLLDHPQLARATAKMKVMQNAWSRFRGSVFTELTQTKVFFAHKLVSIRDAFADQGAQLGEALKRVEEAERAAILAALKSPAGVGFKLREAVDKLRKEDPGARSLKIEEGFQERTVQGEASKRRVAETKLFEANNTIEDLKNEVAKLRAQLEDKTRDAAARRGEVFAMRAHMVRLRHQVDAFRKERVRLEQDLSVVTEDLIAALAEPSGLDDVTSVVPGQNRSVLLEIQEELRRYSIRPIPLGLDHLPWVLDKVTAGLVSAVRTIFTLGHAAYTAERRASLFRSGEDEGDFKFGETTEPGDLLKFLVQDLEDEESVARNHLARCEAAASPLPHFVEATKAAGSAQQDAVALSAALGKAQQAVNGRPPRPSLVHRGSRAV
eukprot:Hpha_TRINITY_DN15672_c0_g6::TRINITY_DN15672_c0_g6_i1::g.101843::m.101843